MLAGAATALPRPPLSKVVEATVRSVKSAAIDLGVHVVDLSNGAEVYGSAPDTQRILASNTKLFTTATALDAFGPGYFIETPVLWRGQVVDGVLRGDLAVLGSGDPNISGRLFQGDSLAVFRQWAAVLRAQGVTRVNGSVMLVHGMFQGPVVHPDWPRDQLAAWYEAPVAALSFNDNCALVRVWGSGSAGAPAKVEVLPRVNLLDVDNRARTVTKGGNVGVGRAMGSDELVISGSVRRGSGPLEVFVTVPDPVAWFGAAMRSGLAEEGITVAGAMVPTPTLVGTDWQLLLTHRSDLLSTLEVINKRSQNFYAESLLKHLGARRCGHGTWEDGVRVVAGFLSTLGIRAGSYSMVDGSGMSRNNRFTPRQVTTLLTHMYRHPYGREFLLSLPHSGEEDLSWARRLATPAYRGNVFAKTGTLNGVSSLSGFAKAASGKVYAFSILCNRIRGLSQAHRAQDRIVAALIDNG